MRDYKVASLQFSPFFPPFFSFVSPLLSVLYPPARQSHQSALVIASSASRSVTRGTMALHHPIINGAMGQVQRSNPHRSPVPSCTTMRNWKLPLQAVSREKMTIPSDDEVTRFELLCTIRRSVFRFCLLPNLRRFFRSVFSLSPHKNFLFKKFVYNLICILLSFCSICKSIFKSCIF